MNIRTQAPLQAGGTETPVHIETRTRLDELKSLLDRDRLGDDLKVIGSALPEVCKRLERLWVHDRGQDEYCGPKSIAAFRWDTWGRRMYPERERLGCWSKFESN